MKIEHVMVIDDQQADQMLARYAILGYNPDARITEAYDGLEALEILGDVQQSPDLIFLDINMPRMNGFEFLEAYVRVSEDPPIVIMLTSSSQEADREKCADYGAVAGYNTKPLSIEMLQKLEASFSQTQVG